MRHQNPVSRPQLEKAMAVAVLQTLHCSAIPCQLKRFRCIQARRVFSRSLLHEFAFKTKYKRLITAQLRDGNGNRCSIANSVIAGALAFSLSLCGLGSADAAMEGVNRPEMLPKEFTPVIDMAGFLSPSQEIRIIEEIANLEKDTGFKLRVLAQNYPETPGLAIKDFWQVDDNTVVFVADPTFGNILNFNVGASVDLDVPRSFWSRLAGKYGNIFYWREKGEDASIEAAVSAIGTCLREPVGRNTCSEIR